MGKKLIIKGADFTKCAINQVYISVVLTANDSTLGNVSGSGIYSLGESVRITATPIGNAKFVKWNDGNTDPVRTIVVTEKINLTAIFSIFDFMLDSPLTLASDADKVVTDITISQLNSGFTLYGKGILGSTGGIQVLLHTGLNNSPYTEIGVSNDAGKVSVSAYGVSLSQSSVQQYTPIKFFISKEGTTIHEILYIGETKYEKTSEVVASINSAPNLTIGADSRENNGRYWKGTINSVFVIIGEVLSPTVLDSL